MSWWKVNFSCEDTIELELHCQNLLTEGATAVQQLGTSERETYFEQSEISKSKLELLLSGLGINNFEISELQKENWLAGAESFFQPLEIGQLKFDFIWEVPATKPDNDRITILPGMGFGSGHHPTTAMMLELIQSETVMNTQPKRILDFGTGSGILSVAADRLFRDAEIDAIDNDKQAILNAKDNFKLNDTKVNISDQPLTELSAGYDLIVANIFLSVLTENEPELKRLLASNGVLLLSGITTDQLSELKDCYSKWKIQEEKDLDGWHALLLRV